MTDSSNAKKDATAPLVTVKNISPDSKTPSKPAQPERPSSSSSSSWRSKLHIHSPSRRSKSAEPGKERWRDATLPEKERWKDWQKAKDKEQMRGYVSNPPCKVMKLGKLFC
jgi:hypothetical protein